MALELKQAKRIQAKVKLAIGGASGSGKTMGGIVLGYGLIKAEHPTWSDEECWGKIAIIDTENSSGSLYVGARCGAYRIGTYNTIDVEPPFEEQTLIDCIAMCENAGMEVIIIDSASAFWQGVGGALETQGKISERSNNSFTSWKSVKNDQNKMLQAILQSKCHIISTYRAKTEYVQEKNQNGKTVVRNIGTAIIAEGNTQYEYTVMFMVDADHTATATKDRTGIFDGKFFTITPETGMALYKWLAEGEPETKAPPMKPAQAAPATEIDSAENDSALAKAIEATDKVIREAMAEMDDEQKAAAKETIKSICGQLNYKKCTDVDKLRQLYKAFVK